MRSRRRTRRSTIPAAIVRVVRLVTATGRASGSDSSRSGPATPPRSPPAPAIARRRSRRGGWRRPSLLPGSPNRRPLPFGSEPSGRSIAFAASATASGVSVVAAGSTSCRSAHAPENPASAAALIEPPKRSAYAASARSRRARPSARRPSAFSASDVRLVRREQPDGLRAERVAELRHAVARRRPDPDEHVQTLRDHLAAHRDRVLEVGGDEQHVGIGGRELAHERRHVDVARVVRDLGRERVTAGARARRAPLARRRGRTRRRRG